MRNEEWKYIPGFMAWSLGIWIDCGLTPALSYRASVNCVEALGWY